MSKYNKNTKKNHIIVSDIYAGYIRSKIFPVKMPEKMIEDLKVIAKEKDTTVADLVRDLLFNKYHYDLMRLNPQPIIRFENIEDIPGC